MGPSNEARRRAFSAWLRTGKLPAAGNIELKFNPYHDPRNGRFTFAPGGPQSLRRVIISDRRKRPADGSSQFTLPRKSESEEENDGPQPAIAEAAVHFDRNDAELRFQTAGFSPDPARSRRSNIRAFYDPMTLEQVFPGLRTAPGGALVAAADHFLNLTGPAAELRAELTTRWSRQLVSQIKAIDPNYRFESFGLPTTQQGQDSQLAFLRLDRAEAFMRVKGELRPMQVETLRLMQASADRAYDRGIKLLRAGRLNVRLSEQEALGNYIDREVRSELRERLANARIDSSGKGPVRVNRRENDTSGYEHTFRRPDARVGNIAFDVTLSAKTLKTPQVRSFFATDFQPISVIIIRPTQVGKGSTYAIPRPETGK